MIRNFTFTASLLKAVMRKLDKFLEERGILWNVALIKNCKDNTQFSAFSATAQRVVPHHLNAWMVKEFGAKYCSDDLKFENLTVSCIVGAGNPSKVWRHGSGLNRYILELNCDDFLRTLAYKC